MNYFIVWPIVIVAWIVALYIAISWPHMKRSYKQWRTRRYIKKLAHETTDKGLQRKGKRWPR